MGKKRSKKYRRSKREDTYEKLSRYLYLMNHKAIKIYNKLPKLYRRAIDKYFEKQYSTAGGHYWTIAKLYSHAMYIPIFLQIGKQYFDKFTYIDTHAGPGIAKIAKEKEDIMLGSPCIAFEWPEIVRENVPQFRNIPDFNRYIIIEKDKNITPILKQILKTEYSFEDVKENDCNRVLKKINLEEKELAYMFVDPFGDIDTQLKYDTLKTFVENRNVDLLLVLMSSFLIRGIKSIKDPVKKAYVLKHLFGDPKLDIINEKSIIEKYIQILNDMGYKTTRSIPITYKKGTIYNLIIAVKKENAEWVFNFEEYIKERISSYDGIKTVFEQIRGRQKTLDDY